MNSPAVSFGELPHEREVVALIAEDDGVDADAPQLVDLVHLSQD
jgi:hypothetical protein